MADTPMKSIRKFCQECMNRTRFEKLEDDCCSPLCPLYPFRPVANNGRKVLHTIRKDGFGKTQELELTPIRSIRRQCKECWSFEDTYNQIRDCETRKCPLWSLRFGISQRTAKNRGMDV